MKAGSLLALIVAAAFASCCSAFAPISPVTFRSAAAPIGTTTASPQQQQQNLYAPPALQRQRKSTSASVQMRGLFGLGAPEIAIILVAAAFLLGPQKLAELGKDAGKIAGELKEVPKEFQAGLAEGELEAKKMKQENAVAPAKDTEKTDDKE